MGFISDLRVLDETMEQAIGPRFASESGDASLGADLTEIIRVQAGARRKSGVVAGAWLRFLPLARTVTMKERGE
jgi:hypothetical protein